MTTDYAERARALLGARFRPQGREPATGLDCLGVVLCTFGLPESEARRDYRLRGDHRRELMAGLSRLFRRVPLCQRRIGDVLVLEAARDQMHLAVQTGQGFVHADARRGRVVETPGMPDWPIRAVFRRRARRLAGR